MLTKYEEVFANEVRDYIADKEADGDMKLNISEEDIKRIAHILVCDCDYLWETVHQIIDDELSDYNFEGDE